MVPHCIEEFRELRPESYDVVPATSAYTPWYVFTLPQQSFARDPPPLVVWPRQMFVCFYAGTLITRLRCEFKSKREIGYAA